MTLHLDHTSVNRAIASLDVSNNSFGAEGTKLLADAIADMGALTSLNILDISDNRLGGFYYGYATDGSGYGLFTATPEGPKAIADAIKDMGTISSINLLRNSIPVEQAQELVKIMHAKEKLITLCGLSKEETQLNFFGQNLDAGDAVLIANDISDMGALSVLDLSCNQLTEGAWNEYDGGSFDTDLTGL
jgi:Leucine-rich repeat (LRR) protein